jgi:hypothetical protein
VKVQWWYNTSGALRDRFDYTLDYAGNRLTRTVHSLLGSSGNFDEVYTGKEKGSKEKVLAKKRCQEPF